MTREERQAMTPKEKWTNFWYYNWKYVFLAAVALSVIIAGTVTVLNQPRKYTSVLVGTVLKGINAESEVVVAVGEELNTFAVGNTKGDPLDMYVVNYTSDEFSQSNMSWDVQLTAELESQESQLYIFDSIMLERLSDQNAFVDLQAAFPDCDVPYQYAIPLRETCLFTVDIPLPEDGLTDEKDTPEAYDARQREILDDLYIAFRVDGGKHQDRRAAQWEILDGLIHATYGQK